MSLKATVTSNHDHPKTINIILNFPEFVIACKNQLNSSILFEITEFLQSHDLKVQTHFQAQTHPSIFLSNFNFHEFLSTGKTSGYFIILFENLQSDWPKLFWPMSRKSNFSKYGICTGI